MFTSSLELKNGFVGVEEIYGSSVEEFYFKGKLSYI